MSSFGEELKRERELRRITLREVADATKINLRYLEALDKNDFKHLPGGVFNRGFVRAYAQFIGVDADQMVSAYIMEENAQSKKGGTVEPGTETLLRGSGASLAPMEPNNLSEGSAKWLKLGLAVLLVAVVIAAGVFVVLKFVGDAEGGVDAERTDLPKTQTAPAASAAVVSAEDGTQETPTANTMPDAKPAEPQQAEKSPATKKIEIVAQEGARPEEVDQTEPAAKAPAIAGGILPSTTAAAVLERLSANADEAVQATIYIDRATSGRLNCDNRQIDLLNGMPPGTRFDLTCSAFLIVDADDGGALRIGWPGFAPASPGESGVPLAGHRIDVRSLATRGPAENRQ